MLNPREIKAVRDFAKAEATALRRLKQATEAAAANPTAQQGEWSDFQITHRARLRDLYLALGIPVEASDAEFSSRDAEFSAETSQQALKRATDEKYRAARMR